MLGTQDKERSSVLSVSSLLEPTRARAASCPLQPAGKFSMGLAAGAMGGLMGNASLEEGAVGGFPGGEGGMS